MKARIWYQDGAWQLDVPGIGWSSAPSFALIMKYWRGFLNWAQ